MLACRPFIGIRLGKKGDSHALSTRCVEMSLAIESFTDNVRRFCAWVEGSTHDVETARELLLALMQGIPYLVSSEQRDEETPDYPRRDFEGWEADHKRVADFPFQYYRQIFSPCDVDDEPPVIGDIRDDLADIYGDLWHGLQALDRGDVDYAANYWRELYFHHWGHHASAALYAIDEFYRKAAIDE